MMSCYSLTMMNDTKGRTMKTKPQKINVSPKWLDQNENGSAIVERKENGEFVGYLRSEFDFSVGPCRSAIAAKKLLLRALESERVIQECYEIEV
jgi:hypothetical protein